MTNSKEKPKQVLIVVRAARKGYIVEAAGGGDPYPCLEAQDIGEAIIEILDDPEQVSMELEAPSAKAKAPKASKSRAKAKAHESEDDDEELEDAEDDSEAEEQHSKPEGWSAGDELILNLLGSAQSKLRGMSGWRK